jgi:hypothetical protein
MSKPGFYNDNRFRAYPFLKGSVGSPTASTGTVDKLDNDSVVDAGFVMGLGSGYEAAVHSIWLDSVSRSGSVVTFTFKSDAPGLYGKPLVFTRDLNTATQFEVEYVDDIEYPAGFSQVSDNPIFEVSDESSEECPPEPLWSGFLVTGALVNLAATIVSGQTFTRSTDTAGLIEPTLVQSLVSGYISSINLSNQDRTRVDSAAGCSDVSWDFPTGDNLVYVSAKCLRGDVRFKAGYNASIRQEDFNNAVVFGGVAGAGEGTVCNDEPKLFPGETPPIGDKNGLLEGGPRCNEVVRSFNGVGGQFSSLLSGLGVTIQAIPESHTVLIDVNMSRLSVCYDAQPFSEVSEIV